MNFDETIERIMRATDEDDFDPGSLGLEFEKSGDTPFDAVLRRIDLETTSNPGRIRGLRMLSLLARHFCVHRTPEILDLSIRMMEHPNLQVRSAATLIAVFTAAAMLQLGAFSNEVSAVAVERVKEAVSKAIERGLEPEQEKLAQSFMASDGRMHVIAEE